MESINILFTFLKSELHKKSVLKVLLVRLSIVWNEVHVDSNVQIMWNKQALPVFLFFPLPDPVSCLPAVLSALCSAACKALDSKYQHKLTQAWIPFPQPSKYFILIVSLSECLHCIQFLLIINS